MSKYIAVNNCTLKLDGGQGTITTTSVPSTNKKIDGQGIHRGPLAFTISGYTDGTIMDAGTGTGGGVITSSAVKTKCEMMPVVLEGDFVSVQIARTANSVPFITTDVVKVSKAGQTITKGG